MRYEQAEQLEKDVAEMAGVRVAFTRISDKAFRLRSLQVFAENELIAIEEIVRKQGDYIIDEITVRLHGTFKTSILFKKKYS